MGAHRVYRERNYAFGQQLLTLRTRAHLTQIALAEELGVNRRSVLKWEGIVNLTTACTVWYHRSHDNNIILAHV